MELTMTQEKQIEQIEEQLFGPMVLHKRANSEGGEPKMVVVDGEIRWKTGGLGKAGSIMDVRRRGLGAAKTVLK
jgi:hypothetical protein